MSESGSTGRGRFYPPLTNKQRRHAVAPTASRGLEFFRRIQPGPPAATLQICFATCPLAAAPRCSPSRFSLPTHTPTNTNRFRHLAGMFLMDRIRRGKQPKCSQDKVLHPCRDGLVPPPPDSKILALNHHELERVRLQTARQMLGRLDAEGLKTCDSAFDKGQPGPIISAGRLDVFLTGRTPGILSRQLELYDLSDT